MDISNEHDHYILLYYQHIVNILISEHIVNILNIEHITLFLPELYFTTMNIAQSYEFRND